MNKRVAKKRHLTFLDDAVLIAQEPALFPLYQEMSPGDFWVLNAASFDVLPGRWGSRIRRWDLAYRIHRELSPASREIGDTDFSISFAVRLRGHEYALCWSHCDITCSSFLRPNESIDTTEMLTRVIRPV